MIPIRAFVLAAVAMAAATAQTKYSPPSFFTDSLPAGTVGKPYSAEVFLSRTSSVPTEIWLIADNSLPPGLAIGTSHPGANGTTAFPITGTPTKAGSYPVKFEAWEDCPVTPCLPPTCVLPLCGLHLGGFSSASVFRTYTFSIDVALPLQITTTSPLPDATVNRAYSVTFSSSGGIEPYAWSFAGNTAPFLVSVSIGGPPSITFNGTPTQAPAAPYVFTATVKDSTGATASRQFSLTVRGSALSIKTASPLPDATANEDYPPVDFSAAGGVQPYQWSLAGGSSLPPDLTLSQSGTLSGVPRKASDTPYTFTIQVADSAGATASQAYTLRVKNSLVLTLAIAPGQITPAIPANCATAGSPAGTATVKVTAIEHGKPAENLVVEVDLHVVRPSGGHPHMTEMSQDDADALLGAPLVQGGLPGGCVGTFPSYLCKVDSQGNISIPLKAGEAAFDLTARATAGDVTSTIGTLQIRLTGLQDLAEPTPQSPLFYFDLGSHTGVGQSGPEQNGRSGDIVLTNFLTTLAQNLSTQVASADDYKACQSSLLPLKMDGMSLPYGGVYDICWDGGSGCKKTGLFQPPHISHRQGNDVDISLGSVTGVRSKVKPECRGLLEKEVAAASGGTATIAALEFVEAANKPGNSASSHWHIRLPLANPGTSGACPAPPPQNLALRKRDTPASIPGSVQVKLSFSGDPVNYSYQYSAANLLPGGDIDALAIPFRGSPSQVQSATGWSASVLAGGGVRWGASQLPDVPQDYADDGGMLKSPAVIATGATLSGFSFLSPMPPTVTTYSSRVYQPLTSFASEQDLENSFDTVPANTLFQGATLAPRSAADSPAAIVTDLTAISNRCMDLGWITDANVIQDLQSRLNFLQSDLNAGANVSVLSDAKDLLTYTINQQSSMSSEAFAVFNFNANYLVTLAKLQTPPLAIATASLAAGQAGAAYRQTLSASGGTPPYTWGPYGNGLANFLPPGLSGTQDGVISGVPTQPESYTVQINLSDAAGAHISQNFSLKINPAPLTITTSSLPPGQVGVAYRQSIAASGGTPPYTWGPYGSASISTPPPGLAGSSDGVISGIPTQAGTFTVLVAVADSTGARTTKSMTLTINPGPLAIATSSLASGQVGTFYSQTLTATGGAPPYSWTFVPSFSSSLPPGLSLTSAGVISGIPTGAGTYTIQIALSDSAGVRDTRSIPLTISAVPLTVTTTSLPNAKVRQFYSVTVSATGGTPPYTFEFGNGIGTTLPPGLNGTQSGIISGTPTSAGNFSVQITVLDSFGAITTRAVTLSVLP